MSKYVNNCAKLPEGYAKLRAIDLKNNKQEFWLINMLSLGITLVVVALGILICPFERFVEYLVNSGYWMTILILAVIIVGMLVYVILHELTHGIFFKYFSGVKPRYGISLFFAYAKSDYYYNKRDYTIIGLAPVVLFGVIFAVLSLVLPIGWFWPIHILQIINLSGAAGDFYVSAILIKQKKSVLIYDVGTGMTIYDYMPEKAYIDDKDDPNPPTE